MYEWLFQKLLYPTYESHLRRRKTLSYLREYQRSQWLSADELETLQWRKLKALLNHCYQHVPYYRSTWKALGIEPSDIKTPSDFHQLPILTKDSIRNNYQQLIADNYRDKIMTKATGGSTGEPLQLAFDPESNQRRTAVMWRCYGWSGVNLGTRATYLWGTDVGEVSSFNKLKKKIYLRAFNHRLLDVFAMSKDNLSTYVDRLNKQRPAAIVAYTEPLYRLAKYIENNKLSIHSPNAIITGAECLHDHQRILIEKVFQCPVTNTYGCREFMSIAAECQEHKGLHINHDHLVVETIAEDANNVTEVSGDVVVTDLHNYGMPFIRYVNGDLATISTKSCSCGRNLPLMQSVEGRKVDVIQSRQGHRLTGLFFPHLFKECESVDQYQVIQDNLDSINVNIVSSETLDSSDQEFIQDEIQKKLGDNIQINFSMVEAIPVNASGKHRMIISNLQKRAI